MQEFDQCPGCKEDLLLEAPDTQGKGLRCLGCGYTCEATGAGAVTPSCATANQESEAYWKGRCEAAESVIEAVNTKNEAMYLVVHQAWLDIKEGGEPA